MKKLITLILAGACLTISVPALAQFGGLKLPTIGGSAAVAPDIDTFLTTAKDAELLVRVSSRHVFNAVATDEERRAIQAERDAAAATMDPKEREAALKRVDSDTLARINKMDMDARAADVQKHLDAQKNAQLGAGIYNLALGLLKDQQLASQVQPLSQSLSNPMNSARYITKIGEFKDTVASISGQATQAPTIIANISKLASTTKVTALPTSATDAPKQVAGD